jgi:mono/diheme cytochrome c family protein
MYHKIKVIVSLLLFFSPKILLAEQIVPGRWYSYDLVKQGSTVFTDHCAICHGKAAEGITADWKKTLADGTYPPPPLNGSAHAWHHPMSILLRTINKGGASLGGKMPPFKNSLNKREKYAAIAYFQNWWPDNIYNGWIERGGLSN